MTRYLKKILAGMLTLMLVYSVCLVQPMKSVSAEDVYHLTYEFKSEDPNLTLPEGVLSQVPAAGTVEHNNKGIYLRKIFDDVREGDWG